MFFFISKLKKVLAERNSRKQICFLRLAVALECVCIQLRGSAPRTTEPRSLGGLPNAAGGEAVHSTWKEKRSAVPDLFTPSWCRLDWRFSTAVSPALSLLFGSNLSKVRGTSSYLPGTRFGKSTVPLARPECQNRSERSDRPLVADLQAGEHCSKQMPPK